MHFDQYRHAVIHRLSLQCLHLRQIERGGDQQNRIGTHRPGFSHLIGIDQEILAQHRQRTGRARRLQVFRRTLKVLAIGQNRKTGRTMFGVAARDICRTEISTDHAF